MKGKKTAKQMTHKENLHNNGTGGRFKNKQAVDGTIEGDFIKTGPVIKSGSISADELQAEYPKKEIPVRPVTVRIEDFKKNLNRVVAESELPPFLSVMILREMLMAINSVAETEYARDREKWEKACKEYGEGEKDG